MKIPEDIINEISHKADFLEIAGKYVTLKRKGGRWWGCCPFHSEKTPSFTVTPEKGVYYCFGCQKGGGVYNFLMDLEKISFVEAVKMVGDMVGIPVNTGMDSGIDSVRGPLIELYKKVAGSFHYILKNSGGAGKARKYLADRGLGDDVVDTFKLGYAPGDRDWLFKFLLKKSYTKEFLVKTGLFSTKYERPFAFFRDRVIFPIFNTRGEVVAFGGRILGEGMPKYLNSPETHVFKKSNNLYGIHNALDSIKKNNYFYLVEGYIDVIAMYSAGIKNCVAPLGTALTENQVRLLKRYAEKGVLIFDGDEAGVRATVKAAVLLEKANMEAEVVALPEKSDPADILQKDGINTLQNFLKCSINSFEYLVKKAIVRFDVNSPTGKEKIFDYLFKFLETVDSQVRRDGYLNRLAERLDVDQTSVRNDFYNRHRRERRRERAPAPIQSKFQYRPIRKSDELFLMLAVAVNRDFFKEIRKYITVEILEDENARLLFIALEEWFGEDKKALESLLEKVDNIILKNLIIEKSASGEFTINIEKIIYDGIYRIKKRTLGKRRNEVSILLKKYRNEPQKMNDLLIEKMVLDREFEELKVIKDVSNRE